MRYEFTAKIPLDIEVHPVGGDYFEYFYLPMLGPTAYLLALHLTRGLGTASVLATSKRLLAKRLGVHDGVVKNGIARLARFSVLVPVEAREDQQRYEIAGLVPELTQARVAKLDSVGHHMHISLYGPGRLTKAQQREGSRA